MPRAPLSVTDVWHELAGLDSAARAHQDTIERLHRRSCETAIHFGIPIATGTDCGVQGVTPDLVAREVRPILEHGVAPMTALTVATSIAARTIGLEDQIGTVEVGKRADVILVDGNPLGDLRCLEQVQVVVKAAKSSAR